MIFLNTIKVLSTLKLKIFENALRRLRLFDDIDVKNFLAPVSLLIKRMSRTRIKIYPLDLN